MPSSPLEEVVLNPAKICPNIQPCDINDSIQNDQTVPNDEENNTIEIKINQLESKTYGGLERENTLDNYMEELQTLSMELTRESQERRQQLQRDKIFQNDLVKDINNLWKECVEVVGNDRLMDVLNAPRHESD